MTLKIRILRSFKIVDNFGYSDDYMSENMIFLTRCIPTWFHGQLSKNSWMVSRYHHLQLSRVYPKAQRVGSDNYNPVPMWNVGSQMTALNFQTGDKPMQLNQAKFMQNGGCGYVLRPEYMFQPNYSPLEPSTITSDLTIILGMWFN